MNGPRVRPASPTVAGNLRGLLDACARPATPSFVALTLGLAWLFWFSLANADYANFTLICNHDPGAVLAVDRAVSLGRQPGVDFLYHYGPLPLLVGRAFFSVFGRSPPALLGLLAGLGTVFCAGLVSIVQTFKPTRLGLLLVAVASAHTITVPIPTHVLEAALLIWSIALRIHKHRVLPLVLASCAIFVKISMPSVMLAGLMALTICDAVRERSWRPTGWLAIVPVTLAAVFVGCSLVLGQASVLACFAPRLGAELYRAADLGFFREGRHFWHPAGHTLAWYVGGLPGPWLAASALLVAIGPLAAVRFTRGVRRGLPCDLACIRDETFAIACVGTLAFVAAFFGPSSGVCYYSWLALVGVTPILARAGWDAKLGGWTPFGWLALAGFLVLSTKASVAQFAAFVRQPRVWVGGASLSVEEAAELKQALSLAHRTGNGSVCVVARVANFGLVDPTLREAHYWMMQVGMRPTPSVVELLALARSSGALFVTQFDYPGLLKIPAFRTLLTRSARLHEGKHFMILRPTEAAFAPQ